MAEPDKPTWVELLDERTPHLIKELVPTKLLPYLNLPISDRENIECDEKNKGKQVATVTLFSKLTKRNGPNGQKTFEQLVRALRNVGNQFLSQPTSLHSMRSHETSGTKGEAIR